MARWQATSGSETMNVLVLSPHTDDGELGAGGTIARLAEEGAIVHYLAFSAPRPELRDECKSATDILGIARLTVLDFEHRAFPGHRQDILQAMIDLRQEGAPNLVLCSALNDIHQDHQVVAAEAVRAFKHCSILGYEQPWNNLEFATRLFVRLEQGHVDAKVAALACYESQRHRAYLSAGFLPGLARTRGAQIESTYAEAFDVLRWII